MASPSPSRSRPAATRILRVLAAASAAVAVAIVAGRMSFSSARAATRPAGVATASLAQDAVRWGERGFRDAETLDVVGVPADANTRLK